jgi:hypothetical protein
MLPIRQQPRRGHPDVLVHRLDPAVRALDEQLGVQETLDTEDDAVVAAETDGDARGFDGFVGVFDLVGGKVRERARIRG